MSKVIERKTDQSVIVINYRGGEIYLDLYEEKIFAPYEEKIDFGYLAINQKRCDAKSLEEAFSFLSLNWQPGTTIISNDHVITYGALKRIKQDLKDRKLGLIVIDQHMDIYNYEGILNKATVFRSSFEKGLIDYIVFVGTRASEESSYRKPLIKIPEHDKVYSEECRSRRVFGGLEDKFSIIPSYKFQSFSEGIIMAIKILKEKGISSVGLDIDLDGFDSETIVGVEYNKDFGDKLIDFMLKRILEKGFLPPLETLKELVNYIIYMKSEMSQKGISEKNISNEMHKVLSFLKKQKMELVYRGITEFEPSNDDGETKKLVEEILLSF